MKRKVRALEQSIEYLVRVQFSEGHNPWYQCFLDNDPGFKSVPWLPKLAEELQASGWPFEDLLHDEALQDHIRNRFQELGGSNSQAIIRLNRIINKAKSK